MAANVDPKRDQEFAKSGKAGETPAIPECRPREKPWFRIELTLDARRRTASPRNCASGLRLSVSKRLGFRYQFSYARDVPVGHKRFQE